MTLLISLFFLLQGVDGKITGEWDLWIPGAVVYLEKDRDLYRTYTPGAPMNRLTITRDGRYTWGTAKGKLKKTEPWYKQPGTVYYSISDGKNNTYDFWYKRETDELIFLFGEVGGHAATAGRIGHKVSSPAEGKVSPEAEKKQQETRAALFKKGDRAEILWSGQWYKGAVLEVRGGQYKVSYDGWGPLYDEWVNADRLRKIK